MPGDREQPPDPEDAIDRLSILAFVMGSLCLLGLYLNRDDLRGWGWAAALGGGGIAALLLAWWVRAGWDRSAHRAGWVRVVVTALACLGLLALILSLDDRLAPWDPPTWVSMPTLGFWVVSAIGVIPALRAREEKETAFAHRRSDVVEVLDVRPDEPGDFEPYFFAGCSCKWSGPVRTTADQAFDDARRHGGTVDPVPKRLLG